MFIDIKGYEGIYQVNEAGDVYSIRNHRVIKGGIFSNGYRFVNLSVHGKHKNHLVHRLVAEAFLNQRPVNKLYVNHIDGNKLNNHISNLEWCTQSENLKHAIAIGLVESQCKIRRSVTVTHPKKGVMSFKTMADCCDWFGFTKCWLNNYIRKNGNPCIYMGYRIEVGQRG